MKRILSVLFVVLLVFTLGAGVLYGCSAETEITWSNVKAGKVSPADYLDYLSETMPELKQAEKQGVVKKVLYNPSEKELKVMLTELLEDRVDVDQIVEDNLYTIRTQPDNTGLRVIPAYVSLFGKNSPVFIVAYPYILEHLQQDSEISNVILHELQHANDLYYGINVAGEIINEESFEKNEISGSFWMNLGELRAYHRNLYAMFDDMKNLKKTYSDSFVLTNAEQYVRYYFALQASAITDTEKIIARNQISLFSDLKPIRNGEQTKIEFILNGEKGTFVMSSRPLGN